MNTKGYQTYIVNEFGGCEKERLNKMLSNLITRHEKEKALNKKVINNEIREEERNIANKRVYNSKYNIEKEDVERKLTIVERNFYRRFSLDSYEQSINTLLASNEDDYYKGLGIARLAVKWPGWHPISQLGEYFISFYNNIGEKTWFVEFDTERDDRYFRVERKEPNPLTLEDK